MVANDGSVCTQIIRCMILKSKRLDEPRLEARALLTNIGHKTPWTCERATHHLQSLNISWLLSLDLRRFKAPDSPLFFRSVRLFGVRRHDRARAFERVELTVPRSVCQPTVSLSASSAVLKSFVLAFAPRRCRLFPLARCLCTSLDTCYTSRIFSTIAR